jgi:hypothetical protein
MDKKKAINTTKSPAKGTGSGNKPAPVRTEIPLPEEIEAPSTWHQQPTDAAPLILARVLYGLLYTRFIFQWLIREHWVKVMFTTPSLQISYPLFEWIQTLPLEGLNIIMGALLVASVFFTVGFLYRRKYQLIYFRTALNCSNQSVNMIFNFYSKYRIF